MKRISLNNLLAAACLALSCVLAGCERAPSVDILGSFFPIWIFCIAGGILFTLLMRQLFIRIGWESSLGPLLIVYPALSALFAFVIWLIFFR